ncbi:hypothetical protein [Lactiplantibacillus carotarum]|uniref:hypothetical protein n=1 Tax=Lactiplantibacillus carotarum TaxID=2993456 RepID=UPI00384CC21D
MDDIIGEDSTYDTVKQMVFTRLIYQAHLTAGSQQIILASAEHTAFQIITRQQSLQELALVPYLPPLLIKYWALQTRKPRA